MRQRVALDASRAYYRAAVAQVGLDAALDLSSWLDTVVAYNRTRVKEGVAAEADLIRSELERDRAAADATVEEADLARARADLATFVGDSTGMLSALVVVIADAPLALSTGAFPPVGAVDPPAQSTMSVRAEGAREMNVLTRSATLTRALAQRPEVRAARERVAAASAGAATERAMLVRQLGLTFGTKQSAGATSMIAGISLPFPLFDQNRGEVARAVAERDAAAFELAAEERAVRAQVAGAYEAARLLTERAGALSQRSHGYLARADEARRIALGAYREGAVPLIQVIDAARAWGEARVAYYRILFAQHQSVLDFVAAQGGDVITSLPSQNDSGDAHGSAVPTR
jgi:outer membrane protein, heavy metal efflux system